MMRSLDNRTAVKFLKGEYHPITRDLRRMQTITAKIKAKIACMKLASYANNSQPTKQETIK